MNKRNFPRRNSIVGLAFLLCAVLHLHCSVGSNALASDPWSLSILPGTTPAGTVAGSDLPDPSLRSFLGYLHFNRDVGQGHHVDSPDSPVNSLVERFRRFPQCGFIVGAAFSSNIREDLGLLFRGFYTGIDPWKDVSEYEFTTGNGWREWTIDGYGWFTDASLLVSLSETRGMLWCNAILGVRYDYYARDFKSPGTINGTPPPGIVFDPGDKAELTAYAVLPYAGLETRFDAGSSEGNFRAIISPLVLGSLEDKEWWLGGIQRFDKTTGRYSRGWLIEAYGDYLVRLSEGFKLGFFVSVGGFNGYGNAELDSVAGGVAQSGNFDFWYRKLLYAGGLHIKMELPSLSFPDFL